MKTTTPFLLLCLSSVLGFCFAAFSLTSCSDSDFPQHLDPSHTYKAFVFGDGASQRFVLKNMKGKVLHVESDASWVTATIGESTSDGCPVIIINNGDGMGLDARIMVTAEKGERAIVNVTRMLLNPDSFNQAADYFVTNWWECDTVPLQGISTAQRTPWSIEGGVTIPNALRLQYMPEHGWEMAFCYLNDDTMEGVRFFALYNKWSGQLRVYTYIKDPTGWGNDIAFRSCFGEYNSKDMFPYTLTDVDGKAQGTVTFAPGTEADHVAELTTSLPGLKHFSRVTFLDNRAWPLAENSGTYKLGDSREEHFQIDYYVDDHSLVADYTQKFVCVREKSNGVNPLYVGITGAEHPGDDIRIPSKWCPAIGNANMIANLIKSDFEFYKACFDAAGIPLNAGELYWIDDSRNYVLYNGQGCITLDSGTVDYWDIAWHSPTKRILLKIDWEND